MQHQGPHLHLDVCRRVAMYFMQALTSTWTSAGELRMYFMQGSFRSPGPSPWYRYSSSSTASACTQVNCSLLDAPAWQGALCGESCPQGHMYVHLIDLPTFSVKVPDGDATHVLLPTACARCIS